ncbi:hypothetical protein RI129_002790 [Pyrocoelia pectoralis]|uniref:Uncharacterized protein n=1 Tax=Pyrocoelia pectoralis TaxID=417401 RepID=A0AAN7VNM5_9COLE
MVDGCITMKKMNVKSNQGVNVQQTKNPTNVHCSQKKSELLYSKSFGQCPGVKKRFTFHCCVNAIRLLGLGIGNRKMYPEEHVPSHTTFAERRRGLEYVKPFF